MQKQPIEQLIVLYDLTSSMGPFIPALIPTVAQISVITKLCADEKFKIGIGWYRDYDGKPELVTDFLHPTQNIYEIVKYLNTPANNRPSGGGGMAEAFKTSFNKDVMPVCDNKTLIIHYTDAFPHKESQPDNEGKKEKNFLTPNEWSWDWIVNKFKNLKTKIITFHSNRTSKDALVYNDLGDIVYVEARSSDILQKTINEVLKVLNIHVDQTMSRFHMDQEYKKHCIDIFTKHLITDDCIDALETNPLFLGIWRAICATGEKEVICQLSEKMGKFAMTRTWLSDMIIESYRDIVGVKALIDNRPEPYPAICYTGEEMSVKDTMEMARTGNPKAFVKFFSECKVINTGSGGIPLSIKPVTFIKVLSHLVCPGVMFNSKRARWILATTILSTLSDDHPIRDHAFKYLQKVSGHERVLDLSKRADGKFTESMNVAPHMTNLVLALPHAFTTNEERRFYTNLENISRITNCMNATITLPTPRKFLGHAVPSDTVACPVCLENRDQSLMPTPDKCAMCIQCPNEKDPGTTTPNMYECKTCASIYQVVRCKDLNVPAKCHQCREQTQPAPSRECTMCHNKFINYNLEYNKNTWKCGCCEQGQAPIENEDLKVLDVLSHNRFLINMNLDDVLASDKKYSDRLTYLDGLDWVDDVDTSLIFMNKPILLLPNELIVIIKSTSVMGTCNICFSDVSWNSLSSICGNGECKITACNNCMETYWNRNAPGKIFYADLCPYCRREPKGTIWKKWNKDQWRNLKMPDGQLDPSMYHFWCRQCHIVTPYITRECAENAPEIVNQMCITCQQPVPDHPADGYKYEDSIGRRKNCPSCTTLIEHGGGCNHMECECGTHFCFVCENVFDEDTCIYDHFEQEVCPMYGF
jgi:hypothetical protein